MPASGAPCPAGHRRPPQAIARLKGLLSDSLTRRGDQALIVNTARSAAGQVRSYAGEPAALAGLFQFGLRVAIDRLKGDLTARVSGISGKQVGQPLGPVIPARRPVRRVQDALCGEPGGDL